MKPEKVFRVRRDDAGRRLDRVLRLIFPDLPLGTLYRAVRVGQVRVAGNRCRPDRILAEGEDISVGGRLASNPGTARPRAARASQAETRDLPPLSSLILHRNPHFLALNKPRGLATHGRRSIEQIVQRDLAGLLPPSLSFTPGPLHRLDAGTTGLLLFSASLEGAHAVTAAFREKRVEKTYLAVFDGSFGPEETWRDILVQGGKEASMEVSSLARAGGLTLGLCRLITGRHHQIRLQGARRGHPLCGDRKYGGSDRLPWFLLHCVSIRFNPPLFGVAVLTAPLPATSRQVLEALFGRLSLQGIV
jgi:23S rRNA pseudouridine955/2504/2580 synthase